MKDPKVDAAVIRAPWIVVAKTGAALVRLATALATTPKKPRIA